MSKCYQSGDFGKYFTENMNAIGLPAPKGVYGHFTSAISQSGVWLTAASTYKAIPLKEVMGASYAREIVKIAGAIGVSYYTGATIGSIAVASTKIAGCAIKTSDLFVMMEQHDLKFKGATEFYAKYPQILNIRYNGNRKTFAILAKNAPDFQMERVPSKVKAVA